MLKVKFIFHRDCNYDARFIFVFICEDYIKTPRYTHDHVRDCTRDYGKNKSVMSKPQPLHAITTFKLFGYRYTDSTRTNWGNCLTKHFSPQRRLRLKKMNQSESGKKCEHSTLVFHSQLIPAC